VFSSAPVGLHHPSTPDDFVVGLVCGPRLPGKGFDLGRRVGERSQPPGAGSGVVAIPGAPAAEEPHRLNNVETIT
jgi:hypothetical protein